MTLPLLSLSKLTKSHLFTKLTILKSFFSLLYFSIFFANCTPTTSAGAYATTVNGKFGCLFFVTTPNKSANPAPNECPVKTIR